MIQLTLKISLIQDQMAWNVFAFLSRFTSLEQYITQTEDKVIRGQIVQTLLTLHSFANHSCTFAKYIYNFRFYKNDKRYNYISMSSFLNYVSVCEI